jgi:predicted TIM-barrel fold metal-dependent hydrolase
MDEHFNQSLHSAFAAFHVERVIVSGPAEASLAAVDLAPGVLLAGVADGAGSVLPRPAEFAQLIAKRRIALLGELDGAWDGVSLGTDRLDSYFSMAEERDLPVAVFTGVAPSGTATRFPAYRLELGRPAEVGSLLARHPRLRIYLMQAGWPFLDETIATMHVHAEVYADLGNVAANPTVPRDEFYRYLRVLIQAGLGKRLMFGSGLELTQWADGVGAAVRSIAGAPFLSGSNRDDIFYRNAERFLKLNGADRAVLATHRIKQKP